MTEFLRSEILEAEKYRIDLLKWKFISVAVLGSIALGAEPFYDINSDSHRNEFLLIFCLIPLVCIYVDIICKHLNLRIHVISEFIRNYSSLKDENLFLYEFFCDELHNQEVNPFSLEDLAQEWSTIIISLLIVIIAFSPKVFLQNSFSSFQLFELATIVIWIISTVFIVSCTLSKIKEDASKSYLKYYIFPGSWLILPILPTFLEYLFNHNCFSFLLLSNYLLVISFSGLLGIFISILLTKAYYKRVKNITYVNSNKLRVSIIKILKK